MSGQFSPARALLMLFGAALWWPARSGGCPAEGVAFSVFQSFLLCIYCLCLWDEGGDAEMSLLFLGTILVQRDDFSSRAVVLNRPNAATCKEDYKF